jgi:ketosteroid isomerase-like protein
MPDDPVRDRAQRFFDLWNAEGIEVAVERGWAPAIVWEEPARWPDSGVHSGRDACVRRMRERFDLIGAVEIELVDVWGDERAMLIEAIVHGRGTTSGAPIADREFFIMEIEDGLATRFREFLDREDALAAFGAPGLSPDR